MVVTFFLLNGLVKVGESVNCKFTFISRMLERYQFYAYIFCCDYVMSKFVLSYLKLIC